MEFLLRLVGSLNCCNSTVDYNEEDFRQTLRRGRSITIWENRESMCTTARTNSIKPTTYSKAILEDLIHDK